MSPSDIGSLVHQLNDGGFLTSDANGPDASAAGKNLVTLNAAGRAGVDRLVTARRHGRAELLTGWEPEKHPEIADLLNKLARELLANAKFV